MEPELWELLEELMELLWSLLLWKLHAPEGQQRPPCSPPYLRPLAC